MALATQHHQLPERGIVISTEKPIFRNSCARCRDHVVESSRDAVSIVYGFGGEVLWFFWKDQRKVEILSTSGLEVWTTLVVVSI